MVEYWKDTSGLGARIVTQPGLPSRGFSLVELSIVLLILGVLTRTAIVPMTRVVENRQRHTAESQLSAIRESVIAHVVANGALPCPVKLNALSAEPGSVSGSRFISAENTARLMGGNDRQVCTVSQGGVPAATLGLFGSVDSDGALLDPWNRPYRLAVSLVSHTEHGSADLPDWTSPGEAAQVGLKALHADILVCSRSVGDNCSARDLRSSEIASLVWTSGKDDSNSGAQRENLDGDDVFVSQEHSNVQEHRFDDQMMWVSAADVMYWMLRAGWLP